MASGIFLECPMWGVPHVDHQGRPSNSDFKASMMLYSGTTLSPPLSGPSWEREVTQGDFWLTAAFKKFMSQKFKSSLPCESECPQHAQLCTNADPEARWGWVTRPGPRRGHAAAVGSGCARHGLPWEGRPQTQRAARVCPLRGQRPSPRERMCRPQ